MMFIMPIVSAAVKIGTVCPAGHRRPGPGQSQNGEET